RAFAETRHPVPPGAVLALFSDGLVEDRGRDLDTGLLALSVALSRFAAGSLAGAGTAVLRALGRANGSEDDVALLLVRSRETGCPAPDRLASPGGRHRGRRAGGGRHE